MRGRAQVRPRFFCELRSLIPFSMCPLALPALWTCAKIRTILAQTAPALVAAPKIAPYLRLPSSRSGAYRSRDGEKRHVDKRQSNVCATDQLWRNGNRVFCRQCAAVGGPHQFQRCRRCLGQGICLETRYHRHDAERVLARLSDPAAGWRLDRRQSRVAPHAGRLHGRLVGVGAVDADRSIGALAHRDVPRTAWRFRGTVHSGERRRRGARRPRHLETRPIFRFRAIRRAARAGRRRVLCRNHPEHDRLSRLDFRDFRTVGIGRSCRVVELRAQFSRPGAGRCRSANHGSQAACGAGAGVKPPLAHQPGALAFLRRIFRAALLPIPVPHLAAAISHALSAHPVDPGECAVGAAVPGRVRCGELCRLGHGLAVVGGLDHGRLPPQVLRRPRRHHLRCHDADRRDDGSPTHWQSR